MSQPETRVLPELPPEPERPDCCAGGCATCVLDGWYEELERWREQVAAIRAAHDAAAADAAATPPPAAD